MTLFSSSPWIRGGWVGIDVQILDCSVVILLNCYIAKIK